jgi:hypothetical protein
LLINVLDKTKNCPLRRKDRDMKFYEKPVPQAPEPEEKDTRFEELEQFNVELRSDMEKVTKELLLLRSTQTKEEEPPDGGAEPISSEDTTSSDPPSGSGPEDELGNVQPDNGGT